MTTRRSFVFFVGIQAVLSMNASLSEVQTTSFESFVLKRDWSFIVGIRDYSQDWNGNICGGVFIDRYHVLTAASCCPTDNKQIIVEVGSSKVLERLQLTLIVHSCTPHDEYFWNEGMDYMYDAAIIRLEIPLEYNIGIPFVALSKRKRINRMHETAIQAPYDWVGNPFDISKHMDLSYVKLYCDDEANDFQNDQFQDATMLLADESGNSGVGGILVLFPELASQPVLIGIGTNGMVGRGLARIFTKIAVLERFINEYTYDPKWYVGPYDGTFS